MVNNSYIEMLDSNGIAAVEQLRKDKYRLLEGYIPEILLKNQFFSNKLPFTKGWWMALHDNNYFFFCLSPESSEIELKISKILSSIGNVWYASFTNSEWYFKKPEFPQIFNKNDFLYVNKLQIKRASMVALPYTRDSVRQEKVIKYLHDLGELVHIATERKFANNFLSVYFDFPVNIDFFYEKSSHLRVGEVKFKYPAFDGNFGVDYGQMEMFKSFMKCGIEVFYFILKKTRTDKNWSIFDFLESNDKKIWLYTKLSTDIIGSVRNAPKDTSINGEHYQKYYPIDQKNFSLLAPLLF